MSVVPGFVEWYYDNLYDEQDAIIQQVVSTHWRIEAVGELQAALPTKCIIPICMGSEGAADTLIIAKDVTSAWKAVQRYATGMLGAVHPDDRLNWCNKIRDMRVVMQQNEGVELPPLEVPPEFIVH